MLRWLVIFCMAAWLGWHEAFLGPSAWAEPEPRNEAIDSKPLETIQYDVSDLAKDALHGAETAALLRGMIVTAIAPATWEESPPNPSIAISNANGKHVLSIHQKQAVHAQIRKLLYDLRSLQSKNPPPLSPEEATVQKAKTKIDDALASPTKFEFLETPLCDMVAQLQDVHKISIVIDRQALVENDLAVDAPLTCAVKGVSLRSGLNHLLRPLGLTWIVRDGAVVITSWETADEFLEVVAYDVGDLVDASGDDQCALAAIAKVIHSTVSPTNWRDAEPEAGAHGRNSLSICNLRRCRAMVVSGNMALHAELRQLFRELRRFQREQAGQHGPQDAQERLQSRISDALNSRCPPNFSGTSLGDVIAYLQNTYDIPVFADSSAFSDSNMELVPPVRFNFPQVSLRTGLTFLLKPHDLMWDIQDESLLITYMDSWHLTLVAYDVTDIVAGGGDARERLDALSKMIQQATEMPSWDCSDALGAIAPLVTKEGRFALVVSQSQPRHETIVRLLAQLRAAQAGKPISGIAPAEEKIEKALGEPISLEFTETPLSEVMEYLSDAIGHRLKQEKVSIYLDRKALEDEGIDGDLPVTRKIENAPLHIALNSMLRPLGLGAIIHDNSLVITTIEATEGNCEPRVIDVTDLLDDQETRSERLDSLVNLFSGLTGSHSWAEGMVVPWCTSDRCLLVISQPSRVQTEISCLLADLRALRRKNSGGLKTSHAQAHRLKTQIEEALRRPFDLCFDNCPLDRLVASLAHEQHIPIWLDKMVSYPTIIDPRKPVTVCEKGKSLGDALTAWLDPLDMTWVIRDNTIMITDHDGEEECSFVVYDVTDLVSMEGKATDNLTQLRKVIMESVDSWMWIESGGRGILHGFALDARYALVVYQSDRMHASLQVFLEALRGRNRKEAPATDIYSERSTKVDARIRAALEKPISVEFSKMPIHGVLARLEKEAGLPFRFDKRTRNYKACMGMGTVTVVPIDQETPVTQRFDKVQLADALDLLLEPIGLAWDVDGEMIRIARPETIECLVFPRIYGLADMPVYRDDQGRGVPDLDGMTLAIGQSFSPLTQGDYSGQIERIRFGDCQVLRIQQTWRNHEKIAAMIADWRKDFKAVAAEDIAKLPPLPKEDEYADETVLEDDAPDVEPDAIGPDPLQEGIPWRQAADDNAAFAVDLYKELAAKEPGNLFFSPWSLSTAMAMAYAGARGDTAAEMAKVMHFALPPEQLHAAVAAIGKSTDRDAKAHRYKLLVANRLWAKSDLPLLEDFTDLLRKQYDAEAARVDFSKPQETARKINAWADKQTAGQIRSMVDPASLQPETRMILANAAYFKANWEEPFDAIGTQKQQFFTDKGVVMTPMMRLDAKHRYVEADGIQILEKTYRGDAVAMLILLPSKQPGALV